MPADDKNLQIARLNYDVFRSNILILLEDMAQGANRIKTIVEGLRKFAKRDDGVLNDEVDLNEIIQSCLRLVANQIGRKAKVKLELDADLPKVKGNFQRLEQVVVNILINASQAIEKKMGAIVITTAHLEKENENLLRISDDGKGIDEKTLKQIFDPFFTTKSNQGGTGLGLSIAYGIIKEHKGRIEVESKPGAGTTFSIHIPVIAKGKPMKKILAIDDDQAVLNYLNIMLLQTGAYEISTLVNSAKAFHELKTNNYDLLLLDMDMPDVSGLDILKHHQGKEHRHRDHRADRGGGRRAGRLGHEAGRVRLSDQTGRQRPAPEGHHHRPGKPQGAGGDSGGSHAFPRAS